MLQKISQTANWCTCSRVSFLIKLHNFIKKVTLALVFSCSFAKFLRVPFRGTNLVTASVIVKKILSRNGSSFWFSGNVSKSSSLSLFIFQRGILCTLLIKLLEFLQKNIQINPLSANFTRWSSILKQFVGK